MRRRHDPTWSPRPPRLAALALIAATTSVAAATAQDADEAASVDEEASVDAGTGYEERVTVTGTRNPVEPGREGRHVEVLTGDEIRAHGVRTIPELLQLMPGLDVRRRGVFGMQADLSVRGTSFEQSLILVDGVPMNNPQTGHHNLDLPVPVDAIERVEVLYGGGSSIHGANAAGGVIQFFTRGAGRPSVEGTFYAGDNSLAGGSLAAGWASDQLGSHRLVLGRDESSGHLPGTEFDSKQASYTGSKGAFRWSLAGSERDFGAQNFYSTRFPNQIEFTESYLADLSWRRRGPQWAWQAQSFYREHRDRFVLERSDPSLLTNIHEDYSVGLQGQAGRSWGAIEATFGARVIREELDSTNLGQRDRTRASLFGGASREGQTWDWRVDLSLDAVDEDVQLNPSIAASRRAGPGRARIAVARAYRVPSFTELYYMDPTSAGNADLRPEDSVTAEVGWDVVVPRRRASITLFRRYGRDLIDFVRVPGDTLFRAVNLREVVTDGIEVVLQHSFGASSGSAGGTPAAGRPALTLSYAWLDSSGDEPEGESGYVFDYLKQRLQLRGEFPVPEIGLTTALTASYNERNQGESYSLLDARIGWGPARSGFELFVQGSNLTDERYFERVAVEMPGRWVWGGVRFKLPDG